MRREDEQRREYHRELRELLSKCRGELARISEPAYAWIHGQVGVPIPGSEYGECKWAKDCPNGRHDSVCKVVTGTMQFLRAFEEWISDGCPLDLGEDSE